MRARHVNGVARLWNVFHATGDLRALHQIARAAVAQIRAESESGESSAQLARDEARRSLALAFRRTDLRPSFDALYYHLSHESTVDRAILEFFASIASEQNKEEEAKEAEPKQKETSKHSEL